MIEFTESDGAVTFRVRVVPRASRTEIAGELDGALKVRVSAPPVDGAANDELVRFLAKTLGVPRSDVTIAAGSASKSKVVRIHRADAASIRKSLV